MRSDEQQRLEQDRRRIAIAQARDELFLLEAYLLKARQDRRETRATRALVYKANPNALQRPPT